MLLQLTLKPRETHVHTIWACMVTLGGVTYPIITQRLKMFVHWATWMDTVTTGLTYYETMNSGSNLWPSNCTLSIQSWVAVSLFFILSIRAGRYWSFASRYIVQKYITILLFIAVIKDDCYIRVADCFIRVSRS